MLKKIVFFLCVAVLFLIGPMRAEAVISEHKWGQPNATYAYDQLASSTFGSQVVQVANKWTELTDFSFIIGSVSTAQVYIDEEQVSGVDWAGMTYLPFNEGVGFYEQAYVIINRSFTSTYNANQQRLLICHELGHVMGLLHCASTAQSVMRESMTMYPTTTYWQPQQYDINDINGRY